MSYAKELEQIARDLIEGPSAWFKGDEYFCKTLQARIRDEGRCVYCRKKLWEEFGVPSCTDHLLPKRMYPKRVDDMNNLVFACVDCNEIKHDYDPSEKGTEPIITDTTEITDEVRQRLIAKAHAHIEGKRNSDDWRNEFKTAKVLLDDAIGRFRKFKETDC